MAFNDLELRRCQREMERFMEKRRPPPEIRHEVDLGYRIEGQSVELFTVRPAFRDPEKKIEAAFAKATYVRTHDVWRVFWMRRNREWEGYEPAREVDSFDAFLAVVDADELRCFFG